MFDVEIRRTFSAAHQLKGYDGDCRNLHGHNYSVVVNVAAEKLNEIGIALDFKLLKSALDGILAEYDHHNLSELPEFQAVNPTSEILAQTIFRRMCAKLDGNGVKVTRVRIGESENSAVTYSE